MVQIILLLRYISYYFRAKTRYDVHSPFLSDFVKYVIEDRRQFYAFEIIKSFRSYLKGDQTVLNIVEMGAGSKVNPKLQRTVKSLVKHAAIDEVSGKHLFRMVNHYKPQTILELGTSLGISAMYQAYANLNAKVLTIEGSPEVANKAWEHFNRLGLTNVIQQVGNFDEKLPEALQNISKVDFAFIDGNHTEKASINYFQKVKAHCHENSILVFGDIHWSKEMENAWKVIQDDEQVSLTIDLYHLGIVFFRKEIRNKEHYTLIRSRLKPWRMGFFN